MATQQITDEQIKSRQRKRSIALAIALVAIVAIFYVLTLVKMGPGLFDRVL